MSENETTVYIDSKTFMQSLVSTLFTLCGTGFLIYLSQGSKWWTFVTGSLFLLVLFSKCHEYAKYNKVVLYGKAEAIKWANALDDDKAL